MVRKDEYSIIEKVDMFLLQARQENRFLKEIETRIRNENKTRLLIIYLSVPLFYLFYDKLNGY